MADVITRLKLESTGYDSKLRDASRELAQFARTNASANTDFQKFTKSQVDAARAFGQISTSSRDAKGKVKELVGAYNDMARAYNTLTVEQKRSDTLAEEWVRKRGLPPSLNWREAAEAAPAEGDAIPVAEDSPVYPALAYVFSHRGEMVRMSQMAELCHLSGTYFSRLFLREVGENYTDFVKRQKVKWARDLLHGSNRSVAEISDELGFLDSSYFIRVFKSLEGITPLAYRQQRRNA